jgi:FtsP/CotA-like multicopper oxidase with cupredoxin domain
MPRIARRTFLIRAGTGLAGLALAPRAGAQMMGGGGGGMGGGGGGMGGGSTVVTDPPVSGPLVDPPVAANAATPGSGLVDVTIRAGVTTVPVAGTTARLLTYDGSFIAPTIRARRGDLVRLHFRNDLPLTTATNLLGHPKNVTNVHVHGWHVTPADNPNGTPGDNVHVAIPAGGGTLVGQPAEMEGRLYDQDCYEYDLSMQRPGTLALYHPHVHGTVAEQFWGGLVGALDVADDPVTALQGIDTRLVVLKDITLSNGEPAPYTSLMEYMHGKEGDLVTVNGQLNPSLSMRPNEVKRLRILNASNARFYRVSLQGHALHVVGTDGGLLDVPYPVQEILLASGERVDVLVKAGAKGTYKLLALPYARMGNMATPQITLMTVQVGGKPASGSIPAAVNPDAMRLGGDTSMLPRAQFTLSMGQGRGYINGVSFDVLSDGSVRATEHMSTVGTDEIWEIVNQSGMDHPWHQHVNDAQVIAMSGGDAAFQGYARLYTLAPAWKDTIIVPKWGSVTFRLPIRDYTGMTMFHCHILEHEDIGMMGMWHIMDGGMPPMGM